MEGVRRIDEWHLIEREIDDFDVVFLRNEEALAQLGCDALSRDELSILELVNGRARSPGAPRIHRAAPRKRHFGVEVQLTGLLGSVSMLKRYQTCERGKPG